MTIFNSGHHLTVTIFNFDWGAFWATAKTLSWFEVGMLLCFGTSWPFSILKTLRTGRAEGKSFIFLALLLVGYVFGSVHKLFYHLDVVVILYAVLFCVVGLDYILTLRACRRRARGPAEGEDKS